MSDLIKRLQDAESGSREFEDAIWWPMVCDGQRYRQGPNGREMNVGWGFDDGTDADWRPIGPYNVAPLLTRSLDAIVALIGEKLPDALYRIEKSNLTLYGMPFWASVGKSGEQEMATGKTAPLALCIALLAALQSQEPTP